MRGCETEFIKYLRKFLAISDKLFNIRYFVYLSLEITAVLIYT